MVISGAYADEVAAFLLLFSDAYKRGVMGDKGSCFGEHRYLTISRATESDDSDSSEAVITVDEALQALDLRPRQKVQVGNLIFSLNDQSLGRYRYFVYGRNSLPWFQRNRGPGDSVHLDEEDLTRWRLAERAMARFSNRSFDMVVRVLVSWHRDLRFSFQFAESENEIGSVCLLSIIMVLYGSCHLLGWDSTLPTSVERIMWRAGGLTMVILGITPLITLLLAVFADFIDLTSFDLPLVLEAALLFPLQVLSIIIFVAYPAASTLLIVESIRQLFYLPDPAFELPDLSIYLPHIA